MASTIKLKNGSGAPTAGDLVQGEPALDLTNKRLYTEDSGGTVIEVGTNPYNFTANHNGSAKLATTSTGIDVTGTATMDGLTVSGSVAAGAVLATISNSGANGAAQLYLNNDAQNWIVNTRVDDAFSVFNATSSKTPFLINTNGDISFYEDTGTTPKLFWDASAESLGIGASSPSKGLHLNFSNDLAAIRFQNTANAKVWDLTPSIPGVANSGFSLHNVTDNTVPLHVDNSGNVGIGTSSPSYLIHADAATATDPSYITASSGSDFIVAMGSQNSPGVAQEAFIGTLSDSDLKIKTNNTERMRIDSSGNLLVGRTGPITFGVNTTSGIVLQPNRLDMAADSLCRITQLNNSSGTFDRYYIGSSIVGSITGSGTSTAYNTSSDYRLKEDVKPMEGAVARVLALKPCNFAWKVDGSRVDGFIAHEAQEVVPEAVHGTKDAMRTEEYEVSPAVYEDVTIAAVFEDRLVSEAVLDDEGNEVEAAVYESVEVSPERTEQQLVTEAVMGEREVPDYQGIDQSKLVPLLTAALQEALARIEALEAKAAE